MMVEYSILLDLLPAVSITMGVTYYIMSLRNQEKARQAQLYLSIYKETQTKEAQTDFLDFAKIEMNNTEDWLKLQEDREMWAILAKRARCSS